MSARRVQGWRLAGAALSVLLLTLASCSNGTRPPAGPVKVADAKPPIASGPAFYKDMTTATGINFTYRNGQEAGHYAILESLGGGIGLIDFDGDGLLDLFAPGGG
jgi:hypothetical protein